MGGTDLDHIDECKDLAAAIAQRDAKATGDGSFKDNAGTAASLLSRPDGHKCITVTAFPPGDLPCNHHIRVDLQEH